MNWTDILTSISSVIVIIGSAFWSYKMYRQKRCRFPKASLTQEIQKIKLTDDKICIHTCITIKNIGDVLLSIDSVKHHIYQVLPLTKEMSGKVENGQNLYDEKGKEIDWPIIDHREISVGQFEIEPGENDVIQFDSLIPSNVQVIQVYTYLKNVTKRNKEIGWSIWKICNVPEMKKGG
jgi:hypothetical protein